MFEFHISRQSRNRYEFDDTLFSVRGTVVFAEYAVAARFAEKMNQMRNASQHPDLSVSAGDVYAMGLIDEILHLMVQIYRENVRPTILADAYSWAQTQVGDVESTLALFADLFPSTKVYRGEVSPPASIRGETGGIPNTEISLEEMLMLFLANENPAFYRYRELFDDAPLVKQSRYPEILRSLEEFFSSQPPMDPSGQTLLDLLRAPARAAPHSLYGQLEYIRTHWGGLLKDLLVNILKGMDFIQEERKRFGAGPGPAPVPSFSLKDLEDIERFSLDDDWMTRLVLIAKSVHVWLHQLSKKYASEISRLDQIPDQELELLSRWGITGLWLIGIWERSPASRRIKQLTGNPEALPSAYSIYDYTIAHDLGGDEAFDVLKTRALRYGIMMATDMVPNHTGIFSRWVIEHPEWFIQLKGSPFPSYSFSGEDLSGDDRFEIKIEDGYWDQRDAAVVFRWKDRHTGEERFIYHGNDGTGMPWNDTAQLDFLEKEVRDAVIKKTIEIARRFSIIRFDAAMTLAKRHFQRLWYPLPGSGGDIPSRAAHSVSPQEFERLFPVEFWRELVDRVGEEVPNTLLLAEAFWLMEGYFVRSLGMHRVYNSAFMNMLREEENSKYRDVMKNVLRFNPEILRRFVNFMNNPDEESAATQFGKGDKYFGVATLMVTMPGLPMIGHGQVEGFSEKYGMEYARSYWEEALDEELLRRHEQEIFPLLKLRSLFSGVAQFVLYDVVTKDGHVNEDVFAYSNREGSQRVLVVYNNRYARASGVIQRSVSMSTQSQGKRRILQKTLAQGLDLKDEESLFYLFTDMRSGLDHVRSSASMAAEGLSVELDAYQTQVFMNFREARDHDGQLARLVERLGGRGIPDVVEALRELSLEKVLTPFRRLVHPEVLRGVVEAKEVEDAFRDPCRAFLLAAAEHASSSEDTEKILREMEALLSAVLRLQEGPSEPGEKKRRKEGSSLIRIPAESTPSLEGMRILLIWALVSRIGMIVSGREVPSASRALINEWMLTRVISETLGTLGADQGSASRELLLIQILTSHQDWYEHLVQDSVYVWVRELFSDSDVKAYLGMNSFDERWWFNQESSEDLLAWLFTISEVLLSAGFSSRITARQKGKRLRIIRRLSELARESGFDVQEFLRAVGRSSEGT